MNRLFALMCILIGAVALSLAFTTSGCECDEEVAAGEEPTTPQTVTPTDADVVDDVAEDGSEVGEETEESGDSEVTEEPDSEEETTEPEDTEGSEDGEEEE